MLEHIILGVFVIAAVWMTVTLFRKRNEPLYPLLFGFILLVFSVVGQCTVMEREIAEEEPLADDLVFAHISWTPQQTVLYHVSEWAIYAAGVLVLYALVVWLMKKLRNP